MGVGFSLSADVAQLVEQVISNHQVARSNRVVRSIFPGGQEPLLAGFRSGRSLLIQTSHGTPI